MAELGSVPFGSYFGATGATGVASGGTAVMGMPVWDKTTGGAVDPVAHHHEAMIACPPTPSVKPYEPQPSATDGLLAPLAFGVVAVLA